MPELPEVETMVRGIRPHVAGRVIRRLSACPCTCKPLTVHPPLNRLAPMLAGRRVVDVLRRAKRCVLRLDNGAGLVVEPRMTGLLLLQDPPDREHLRLKWEFAERQEFPALWFWDRRGLGTVRWYAPDALRTLLEIGPLGRDALLLTPADWRELCRRTARPIKVALLDQALVAGIGNLYASEILHRARIHPAHPASQLAAPQLARLASATVEILNAAIRYEGSTLSDGTYRNALNQSGGYQNEHRVYQKAESVCPVCRRGKVRRIVQAQRATFYCPVCQRLPRRR